MATGDEQLPKPMMTHITKEYVHHQGSISQRNKELISQISKNSCCLFNFKIYWSDHVTNLHMSWQLCCHDMRKIVTWLDDQNHNYSKQNLKKSQLWNHKSFVKWPQVSMC